jgi:hypothetical protein
MSVTTSRSVTSARPLTTETRAAAHDRSREARKSRAIAAK